MKAVVGLGANLGDRSRALRTAVDFLDRLCGTRVMALSPVYETAPVGYADQPDFLNMAAVLETTLSPRALLGGCLGIEAAMGRKRSFANAPRVIDIDLLVAQGICCDDPELHLPHPRLLERAFVLLPLQDLFPQGDVWGLSIRSALQTVSREGVRYFAPPYGKTDDPERSGVS